MSLHCATSQKTDILTTVKASDRSSGTVNEANLSNSLRFEFLHVKLEQIIRVLFFLLTSVQAKFVVCTI